MRLHGLDALRGLAALFVAIHHLIRIEGRPSPIGPALAVDLFFILSGFVMTRMYEMRIRDGLTAVQFLKLRYLRLFTPLAIGSTLGFIWAVSTLGPSIDLAAAYVLILAFLPAFWMAKAFLINVPAWSLFLEILSNALHGAVLAHMRNGQLLGLWGAATVAFVGTYVAGLSRWDHDIGSILWLIPRELSCYLAGILLFRVYGDRPLGNQPLGAIALFALLLVTAQLNPFLELAAVLIAAPLVVRASLALPATAWAVWAGALSYPLYATHVPVLWLLSGLHPFLAFLGALMIAWAVTLLVEMRRRSDRPTHTPAMRRDSCAR